MPFTKQGKNDYTSPSGRHFNQAQVRLYYANGGKFPGQKGTDMANGGPVEGSARDVREDKAQAKKAGMTMKQWESSPQDKRHDRSQPAAYAAGGPVLGRTLSFTKDEFTGGRMPPKQSASVTQDYGSKGSPAKRTGDKSEAAVKPRS